MGEAHVTTQTKWGSAVAMVIVLGLSSFAAQAGEVTQKGRETNVCTDQKMIAIGDVPDHWIGVFVCEGTFTTEGGEAGTVESRGIGDFIRGEGWEKGYAKITYDDGSVMRTNWEGTTTRTTGEGTYQITSGTGRFAGINGSGTYTCKNTKYNNWECDWTETYTVP